MKMKMITMGACCLPFLQCLLLGATNGCVFNDHSNEANPDGTKLCCGPNGSVESYFPMTQICCNGTVQDRKGRMCCNGEIYDPTQQICCDDTLHEKENKVCCGSKLHRITTDQDTCCGGELHNSSQGCCGGQSLYNKSSQICCEFNGSFTIATKENNFCCYDKAFDVRSQYCVNNQVLSFNENLCGNEKYNISEKKCCGDQKLYDMPRFLPDCCGSQLFDVNQSQCCRGTKTVIANNRECCGEDSFNETTHLCCNAVIKSKEDGSRCCGSETIVATEGCCGAMAYNLSTHQCCKNSTIIPEHLSCCGYRGYDNLTQLCTDNYTIINRTKIKDCTNTSKSCNNEFSAKRRRVSRSICNTCFWRPRRIYREISSGKQNVCKRHTYNITIDNTTDRDIVWILDAKYENKDKMESYVKIIIPCKSEKLNKTGDYLLVTDSTIDGETLRLGDSDLLIQRHSKLLKLVKKKQRRCQLVSVVLSEIHWAVRRLIRKFLGIK